MVTMGRVVRYILDNLTAINTWKVSHIVLNKVDASVLL